jgi:DNA primase large subunit
MQEEVMNQVKETRQAATTDRADDGRSENMKDSPMMARLLDALEKGTDIGHYGRLTFAMIARHFLDEEELIDLLARQPDQDETKARALVMQVKAKDYSPPKRERILAWQAQQEFPICPSNDPDACNVYRDLRFPDGVYEHISEYYEEKAEDQA